MSAFSVFKTIYDSRNILGSIYKLAKKYPQITALTLLATLPLIVIAYIVTHDNSSIEEAARAKMIRGIIVDAMEYKCKGNIGITIISISIEPSTTKNGKAYAGMFRYAYVSENGNFINKLEENKGHNPYTYGVYIPVEYANILIQQAKRNQPEYFNLKIVDSIPDFIAKLLSISTWYREGKMQAFYADALVRRNNLIYVITLSTTDEITSCSFDTITNIFNDLKRAL